MEECLIHTRLKLHGQSERSIIYKCTECGATIEYHISDEKLRQILKKLVGKIKNET